MTFPLLPLRRIVGLLVAVIFALPFAVAQEEVKPREYVLKVGDFSELAVESSLAVVYKASADSAGMVKFSTVPSLVDKLIFENNHKGKLTVESAFSPDSIRAELPVITVYSKMLGSVRNAGDSTVRIASPIRVPEFSAVVIGNGRIIANDVDCTKLFGSVRTGNGQLVLAGKCVVANLHNTGTGTVQADNLEAREVSAQFVGTGTTGCWPVETLKIKGVMKGKLYFRGNPKNIKNYSMGVLIYHLDGTEWNPAKP